MLHVQSIRLTRKSAQRQAIPRHWVLGPIRLTSLPCIMGLLGFLIGATHLPASASDGCKAMLCLAAPSWRDIAECVPPVQRVLHDLRRGKPFPSCEAAGAGHSTAHASAHAPDFCPPQYIRVYDSEGGQVYDCDYAGAISVSINGLLFTRTWWSLSGDSVTEFSPVAKAQLGSWDSRFEREYAAWLAALPAQPQPSDAGH